MHHQFFGELYYVEKWSLIFGTMIKEVFLGYMTMLISILSLDRWVATKAWAWYESGTTSTLLFSALQEVIIFSVAIPVALLLVYEYVSGIQTVYCFGVIVSFGTILFVFVYRLNLREIREIKRGAVINRYSISRTYQIRENISVFSSFTKLARPLVIVSFPPMIFYPIYELVPSNTGYDGLRFFSVSMYDLWLAISSCVVISCLPIFFPHLKQSLRNIPIVNNMTKIRVTSTNTTSNTGNPEARYRLEKDQSPMEVADIYFSLLSNDLNVGMN